MPLLRLQKVGDAPLAFLYSNRLSGPHEITLKPGVAFCLRRFHDLVVELVHRASLPAPRRKRDLTVRVRELTVARPTAREASAG